MTFPDITFADTIPIMGVIIGTLLFSETLTAAKMIGVLFGLSGVTLLTRTGPVALAYATRLLREENIILASLNRHTKLRH